MIFLFILFGIVILAVILYDNEKSTERKQSKREEDKEWLSETKRNLEIKQYNKEPYYYAYEIPPSINGDFYKQSTEVRYESPNYNFVIYYCKCVYENSASCANCTRRNQISKENGYHYGASNLCYNIHELDMKE